MDALRSLADVVRPSILRRLVELGMLDPRRVVAGAAVLPWVLGRGPSLGSLSQIHATSQPGRRAIVDRRGELTWWQLERRANRLAHAWSALGAEPGDEVGLLLRNGREFVEAVLAAQKAGVVPAPMSTWGRARELGGILERSRPAVLLYDVRHADALEGAVPDGVRLVAVGDEAEALDGSTPYEDVLADRPAHPLKPVTWARGSASLHIHTSGTTGTPKAAERSSQGYGLGAVAGLLDLLDTIPYRRDDVLYVPNPLFHALGIGVLGAGLAIGATMVLPDAFDARTALQDMARHRVTAASFVPVMVRRMLDLDDPPEADLSALRIMLVSGSAMPAELRRRALERFGDVLYDLYGSTEAGWVAVATPESMRTAPDAVGRPIAGVAVAILDRDGAPVGDGTGEIHVRSDVAFEGYASGEATEERDGYLSMGDLGFLDDDGYLHVVGRADDMVVVGGENVHPQEVEDVITELEGVEDAAVVGVEDREMGQVLAAYVVGETTEEAVRAACAEVLPSYKVPRRIELLDELPRTSTGKVLRRELS